MSAVTAPADASILSREALAFVELLQRELGPQRQELLERRRERRGRPDFLEETPEFLDQEPSDQERLWFERKPPKDFDFDS